MTKRRESREQAFTLLFEKTVTGDSMEDIIEMAKEARDVVIDPYCEKLTALTELYLDEIDHTIEENLRGWSLRRLSKMTLTILRRSAYMSVAAMCAPGKTCCRWLA